MKRPIKEGLPLRTVKRAWKSVTGTLAYSHLLEWVVTPGHSETGAMDLLSLMRSWNWLVWGSLAVLCMLFDSWLEGLTMEEMPDVESKRQATEVGASQAGEIAGSILPGLERLLEMSVSAEIVVIRLTPGQKKAAD